MGGIDLKKFPIGTDRFTSFFRNKLIQKNTEHPKLVPRKRHKDNLILTSTVL